nr:MAG TPA: hypothetical protein [Caudoviricetes sp.]
MKEEKGEIMQRIQELEYSIHIHTLILKEMQKVLEESTQNQVSTQKIIKKIVKILDK